MSLATELNCLKLQGLLRCCLILATLTNLAAFKQLREIWGQYNVRSKEEVIWLQNAILEQIAPWCIVSAANPADASIWFNS